MPFDTLNPEDINGQINVFNKIIYTLEKGLPPNEVVPKFKKAVDEIRSIFPSIVDLRNANLKTRHWDKIQEATGKQIVKDEYGERRMHFVRPSLYHVTTDAIQQNLHT